MTHANYFKKILLAASLGFILAACSNEEIPDVEQKKHHTVKMEFIGNVVGFNQQPSTRATSSSWNDGDKIYLTFYSGSNTIPGEALFDSSDGWLVSLFGDLPSGDTLKCEVRYFTNTTQVSTSFITFNTNSEIYEDLNAQYLYKENSLIVHASLKPKTGRIRFTGMPGDKIYITGISTYRAFNHSSNLYNSSNETISSVVDSTGTTPYIYGTFADEKRKMGLLGQDFAFTRTCSEEMLRSGESGYMSIPSENSHNKWQRGLYVNASGVGFMMIPVAGHESGFYLIGETEVTEELYNTIGGSLSTSQFPISGISHSSADHFIGKLNKLTKLNFALPTRNQWQYAAKGGKYSQGYTYSGSNTPGDVAWHDANSNGKSHEVKTKAPNELGIYDMSGNVAEWTCDAYDYSHIYYYYCGGYYSSTSSNITSTSTSHLSSSSDSPYGIGFRLILTCP